jgi:phosphatidylglycerol---prolipoprotein diacylglyceryl transferase
MDYLLGYYIHRMDPFIFRITETFGPRWYGFAYLLAFIVGILFLRYLSRRGYCQIPEDKVTDFIVYTAIFGVMIGGRLGFFLFYRFEEFLADPLVFFRFQEGGMASHGGILGVVAFAFYYSWRNKISWPHIGDCLVPIAPVGIGFGRLANFVNGELIGRPTTVSWAVQFPEEMKLGPDHGLDRETYYQIIDEVDQVLPEAQVTTADQVIEAARHVPEVLPILASYLTPRHPSQLYQAFLEGFLIAGVLMVVRLKWKDLPYGLLTGVFFIIYAIMRMVGETFREPDATLLLGLTRGQFYSSFMIVIGAAFVLYAIRASSREGHS